MSTLTTPMQPDVKPGNLTPGSAHDSDNVAETERWLSLVGGGLLGIYGLGKGNLSGLALAVAGGALVKRGLSGHCALYQALGISTKNHGTLAAVGAGRGVKVEHSITIERPAAELFHFWRQFENLPRFMHHLISVKKIDARRSHWVARAPVGLTVEWDAEIVNEEAPRLIAWRSLTGSDVATAGSVQFIPRGNNRGTEVRVSLKYDPPGGQLGSWIAWAFGTEPSQQIREDLRRYRQLMESGEIATVTGQSSGRKGSQS